MQPEKLLTLNECAAKFQVSKTAIRQMVINDSIPYIRIDEKPYFNEGQIREWQKALIKEVYDKPIRPPRVGAKEQIEYYQHFKCLKCEYTNSVEVFNDDTVYGIVEKIKRDHKDNAPDCKNEIQDIQILMEICDA